MTTKPKLPRLALWLLPVVVLAMGGFLAATPWLKTLDDGVVLLLAATLSVSVMAYGFYLSAGIHHGMDEVQRAKASFGAKWGPEIGYIAFVLLALFPPFQAFITSLVNDFAADPGEEVDRTVVVFTMMMGFMTVMLLQSLGRVVMSTLWWARRR
jgi:hypothetical protein